MLYNLKWCVSLYVTYGLLQAVTLVWENGEDGAANNSSGASLARGLAALGAGRLPSPAARVGAFGAALAWTGILFLLAGSVARPAGPGPVGREHSGPKTVVVLVSQFGDGGGWGYGPPPSLVAHFALLCFAFIAFPSETHT